LRQGRCQQRADQHPLFHGRARWRTTRPARDAGGGPASRAGALGRGNKAGFGGSKRRAAPLVRRDRHDRLDQPRIPGPPGAARRPLFDRARARPGRDGDRAAGPRCRARPPGRHQAAAAAPRHPPRRARALPRGGAHRGGPGASQYRAHSPRRGTRRAGAVRDGLRGRRNPARSGGRAGPLPPRLALKLLQEVAWALGYAHQRGVIHRDVKPDNILIERATDRALVTDFGIALGKRSPDSAGGPIVGTARYMSPEQACGEPVDARSDLYSLGATFFYALTGRAPFEGANTPAILTKHVYETAPLVQALRPEVPVKLAALVDRLLRK